MALSVATVAGVCLATKGSAEDASGLPDLLFANEDLCGWVEIHESCAPYELGTHDSWTAQQAASTVMQGTEIADCNVSVFPALDDTAFADEMPETAEAITSHSLRQSITAIATAAIAAKGISVQQIVEPFAMVGPYLQNSSEMVLEFERWWGIASRESQRDLSPVDLTELGPSVLVDDHAHEVRDNLVGSSPMIFTLEEPYQAYDLAQRDLPVWSVYPIAARPFCIRDSAREWDRLPDWVEASAPRNSKAAALEAMAAQAHANCLLDEFVGRTQNLAHDHSQLINRITPYSLGHWMASLRTSGTRIAADTALRLALQLPKRRIQPPMPSETGRALLARGGVSAEAIDATPLPDVSLQVARQPADSTFR